MEQLFWAYPQAISRPFFSDTSSVSSVWIQGGFDQLSSTLSEIIGQIALPVKQLNRQSFKVWRPAGPPRLLPMLPDRLVQ
ncbi:MAG: hypothetical protein ACKO85_01030, partial [Isosphaeraceae bacterium]